MAEETLTIAPDIQESLETIEEDVVPESLPAEKAEDAQSAPAELAPPPEPETLPEPKRKPGRPAGSRNKGPAKPRAKRVVVTEPVLLPAPPPTPELLVT